MCKLLRGHFGCPPDPASVAQATALDRALATANRCGEVVFIRLESDPQVWGELIWVDTQSGKVGVDLVADREQTLLAREVCVYEERVVRELTRMAA